MKTFLIAIFFVLFSASAFAEPAIHISGDDCGLLDGDGGFVITNDTKTTVTFSKNGNVTLKCKIKGVANSTGRAVRYNFDNTGGAECGTFGGPTENWHATISAGGNATLICQFKE